MRKQEWFGEWFDSPYYHILYKNRDEEEARAFLDNLIAYLSPELGATFLDVACGKGRHSVYLNAKGFEVTGVDLSPQNIREAAVHANDTLKFYQHDMREEFTSGQYDYVLNLFTSFGFFDTKEEHCTTIGMMGKNLRAGGCLVLDFLNPYRVINNLVKEETKMVQGIIFHIRRTYDGEFIIKEIEFNDEKKSYCFYEKVKAIRRTEFLDYFEAAGLTVRAIFGDYGLKNYDRETSERLIFITEK